MTLFDRWTYEGRHRLPPVDMFGPYGMVWHVRGQWYRWAEDGVTRKAITFAAETDDPL